MNLYKLHTDPKSLKHHGAAHEHIPTLRWEDMVGPVTDEQVEDLDGVDIGEVKKYEHLWARDARTAYLYATDIIKKRFPAGEPEIATRPMYSYQYAGTILGKEFPAGEKTIAKHGDAAFRYAVRVLGRRFPAGEKAIAKYDAYRRQYEQKYDMELPNPQ